MKRLLSLVRLLGEIAGLALFGLSLFFCAVLVLIGGPWALLRTGAALGAAHVLAWQVLRRTRAWRALSPRLRLDAWVLGLVAAVLSTWAAVAWRFPIRGERWDAHGTGGSGGEANVLFFPWLHVLAWSVLLQVLARRRVPRS